MLPGRCARRTLLAAVVTLAACGDDGGKPRDAAPDTPIDTPAVCAGVTAFTGEIVDWDSTETSFCGVNKTTWTVRSDTACTSTTAPNGRFQLQIPRQAQTIVDVTPPTAGSECPGLSGTAMNTYKLPAIAIASEAAITAGGAFSARAMVEARVTSMFTQIGASFLADHGQLVVHVNGTQRAVSISAAHATTQRFDGAAWTAGDTGRDVFFPNVDLGAGPVTVTMTGGVGTGAYTLEPGKLTYVALIGN